MAKKERKNKGKLRKGKRGKYLEFQIEPLKDKLRALFRDIETNTILYEDEQIIIKQKALIFYI